MYKVFVNDVPIILSTEKEMAQCTTVPLKGAKFKKLIKKINGGALHRVNLYHKNPEKIERFLRKKLPVVEAAGGLVFNQKKEILFIKRNNKWDLPKGKIEKNETHEAAAIREVVEETGVQDLKINRFIAQTYHVFKRSGKFKLKVTYWYEMHTGYTGKLTPQGEEGIKKVRWKDFEKSQKALKKSYGNIKALFPPAYLSPHAGDGVAQV